MHFAHLTLPTEDVERTAAFLEKTLGCTRNAAPANSPVPTVWLDIGRGQEIHVTYVEGFRVSAFEGEFGRHIAVFHPEDDFFALRNRLAENGADVMEPLRPSPRQRFFFREPVNGYVFELIAGH
jgi:catechol 2,3-dioxygenase-like lactoylglutathione lyase family enzyme